MGLGKSRSRYPRVVLVIENSVKWDVEIEDRKYRKVYKKTTYSGLLQHLTKHSKDYGLDSLHLSDASYFRNPSVGIRASTKDGFALVLDAMEYERLLTSCKAAQIERERLSDGTFAPKSAQLREVRSLRALDETWNKLGDIANSQGITRADLIEQWVIDYTEDSVKHEDEQPMRGGARQNAGRKSTWQSGCRQENTKLIRVPCAIAPQLLDIAHRLDAQEKSILDENQDLKQQVAALTEQLASIQSSLVQAQEKINQLESAKEKDPSDRIYNKYYGDKKQSSKRHKQLTLFEKQT